MKVKPRNTERPLGHYEAWWTITLYFSVNNEAAIDSLLLYLDKEKPNLTCFLFLEKAILLPISKTHARIEKQAIYSDAILMNINYRIIPASNVIESVWYSINGPVHKTSRKGLMLNGKSYHSKHVKHADIAYFIMVKTGNRGMGTANGGKLWLLFLWIWLLLITVIT